MSSGDGTLALVAFFATTSAFLFMKSSKGKPSEPTNRPIIICGPSGVGKGTLINLLMERFPDNQFGFSVSHTTRQPREGEEHGVHYNFTKVEDMKKAIAAGEFVEYAEVHGRYYGTSIKAVENVQKSGKICILDIDIQGVQAVKMSSLKPHYLFIAPPEPALRNLEERLRGRGTEKEDDLQKRLSQAKNELDYGFEDGNFDKIITNDDLNAAFERLVLQIKEWYPYLRESK